MSTPFLPIAALVQELGNGRMEPELAAVLSECHRRGLPARTFVEKRLLRRQLALDPATLVAGYISVVLGALRQLGVAPPAPLDYPEALRPWLRRRVWPATLGAVIEYVFAGEGPPVFVKPRAQQKRFTGTVLATPDDLASLEDTRPSTPVWCAEAVDWRSEWRMFVIGGQMVGQRHYAGDPALLPNPVVVAAALDAFNQVGAPAGYALDVGVLADGNTALVEVNDGFGLGAYGLDAAIYTDLLIARWAELMRNCAPLSR